MNSTRWDKPSPQQNPRYLNVGVGHRKWVEFILPRDPYPYLTRARLAKLDYYIYAVKDNEDDGTGVITVDTLLVVRDESAFLVRKIVFGYRAAVPMPEVLRRLRDIEIPRASPTAGALVDSAANDVLVALRDYEIPTEEREALELYLMALAELEHRRGMGVPAKTLVDEVLIREWHRGDRGIAAWLAERAPQSARNQSHSRATGTGAPRGVAPKTLASLGSLRAALR